MGIFDNIFGGGKKESDSRRGLIDLASGFKLKQSIIVIAISTIIGACGGGGDTAPPAIPTAPTQPLPAPPITRDGPAALSITSVSARLAVTIDRDGTGFFVVRPATEAQPTLSTVQGGTAFAMSSNVASSQSITGLSPSTAYAIYFIAKDTSGLFQSSAQRTTFSTTALPTVVLWRTGQTASWRAGDDGSVQAGTPWPSPRFKDVGNGTVVDNLTGIVWAKHANCFGPQSWTSALGLAKSLSSGKCGITDGSVAGQWRLPNRKELLSLIDFSAPRLPIGHPFDNTFGIFWSSTTSVAAKDTAWQVVPDTGDAGVATKDVGTFIPFTQYYVWPIKIERSVGLIRLAATGQRTCFDATGQSIDCRGTGQDGDSTVGILWDDGRFDSISPECVNDRFTGLMWAKDANLLSRAVTWNQAMDFVDSINRGAGICSFHDWRLPNILELESMVNLEFADSSVWLRGQGFRNVQAAAYWSSTVQRGGGAAAQSLGAGGLQSRFSRDASDFYVWPVRGGR